MQADCFEVTGGIPLKGDLHPQGAKNEALQVICATLLTDQPTVLRNLPKIRDVRKLISLLQGFGVEVQEVGDHAYQFHAAHLDESFFRTEAFHEAARAIRGSVMLIGALLARLGRAYLPMPGGDKIGRRRLDTHFLGIQQLGATFHYDATSFSYQVNGSNLQGAEILMDEISVTGTANVVMAATMAKGTTLINNAACEPYVQQLCKMLNRMGAKISGIGSNLLQIEGVTSLSGTEHQLLPDYIEIGSFIGLAAMTKSEITIRNAAVKELGITLPTFKKLGIQMEVRGDDIYIPAQDRYEIQTFIDGSILTLYDAPWPGFSPDLMSIALVVATQACGSVLIHQKMFESRLFFVDKLIDMGAQIILCDPHRATVIGLDRRYPLRGIQMTSPDIRAGVALLIAALSAEGKSIIKSIHQIDRGYEDIDGRLRAIGANIVRR